MSFRVKCYSVPCKDMEDYAWIAQRLIAFDQIAFGHVEDVQHVILAHRLLKRGLSERLGGCATSCRFGWLHVERLWVEPENRGSGVGYDLLGAAEGLAAKMGLLGVRLVTTDRHTGFALYLRRGFLIDYRIRGRLADGSPIEEIGLSKNLGAM